MNAACRKVCANKGAGGVGEVTVEKLGGYIKENWDSIREQIRHKDMRKRNSAHRRENLSPLLSNIMLNELDKKLEARGLRFTRYADDCAIAVRSESSAKRVMRTVSDWIQRKLRLKVNMAKTHITRPQKLKYLGFGFCKDSKEKKWKCRPHQDSVKKFKSRLKELTCRKMPGIVTGKIAKINQVTRGWINYYALGSMKTAMTETDAHLRTRLRAVIWKQWKVPKKRQ